MEFRGWRLIRVERFASFWGEEAGAEVDVEAHDGCAGACDAEVDFKSESQVSRRPKWRGFRRFTFVSERSLRPPTSRRQKESPNSISPNDASENAKTHQQVERDFRT